MGWTFVNKDSSVSMTDFFISEFNYSNEKSSGRVIACSEVVNAYGDTVVYIAYETIKNEERQVIAIVCLTEERDDFYNFGYKDITEDMGPCETDCPEYILDLLTEINAQYALKWRANCRENLYKNRI